MHDQPPPAEAFAQAAAARLVSRTNLDRLTTQANSLDPDLADDVFGFSTIWYLLGDVSRDTAIGIAAAAVAQLLQQPRS
ncbi:hypothetical protein [Dactylosporangium sp. CA-092794]|uniref:hypothetical protein n=1 Tax=Dactylosporangium sp. CA-092794 TaxID=3239929 RepID=UPI003D939C60